MRRHLNILILLFCLTPTPPAYPQTPKEIAEEVLEQLYRQAGRADKPIPSLAITQENKKVAAYYPARHQIVLDEKAYRQCSAMGADSLDALAFILAHELAHAFLPGPNEQSTNFLVYGIQDGDSNSRERAADIQGAFTAYLVGYRIDGILPSVLERIYKAYGLWGKPVPGYPSFNERSNSVREVMAMNQRLIEVFEAANYLTLLEHYDLAVACNTFLLEFYQGKEIYNNLGVLHVLQAMDYYEETSGRFAYPLEMEAASLLQELERQRGQAGLTETERAKRTALLQSSLQYFGKALERDNGYLSAIGNRACALSLLGQPEEAVAFLQEEWPRSTRAGGNPDNLELAYGIGNALIGEREKAQASFQKALQSIHSLYSLQAQYNLEVLDGRAFSFSPPPPFRLPEAIVRKGRTLEAKASSYVPPLPLRPADNLSFSSHNNGLQSSISFEDGQGSIVRLIRWKAGKGTLPPLEISQINTPLGRQFFNNVAPSPDGYFIRSDNDGLLLKANRQGEVEEVVRWIRFRQRK